MVMGSDIAGEVCLLKRTVVIAGETVGVMNVPRLKRRCCR